MSIWGVAQTLGWRPAVGPTLFAVVAIALLVYDHLNQGVPALVFWLTLGLIVAIFTQTIDTLLKQSTVLEWHEESARSDQITGLENRGKLEADIEFRLASEAGDHVLVLFELEGLRAVQRSLRLRRRRRAAAELRGQRRRLVIAAVEALAVDLAEEAAPAVANAY